MSEAVAMDVSLDTTPIPQLQPYRRRWRLRPAGAAGAYTSIRGEEFEAFDRTWQMEVNPKGFNAQCADYWSFWLHLTTPDEKIDPNYHMVFILHHPQGGEPIRHVADIAEGQHSCWGFFQFVLREDLPRWIDTTDDSLLFEVEIADLRLKTLPDPSVSPCSLSSDLASTLASGLFSDAEVHAGGHTFRVHRLVLVSRSPVLRAMLTRGMEETKNGVILMPETSKTNAALLLNFLYTGQLAGPLATAKEITAAYQTLESVQELFSLAHQYDLNRMTELVVALFRKVLTSQNVLSVMKFAATFPPSCTGVPLLAALARAFAIEHADDVMKSAVGQLPAPASTLRSLAPSFSMPDGLGLRLRGSGSAGSTPSGGLSASVSSDSLLSTDSLDS